MKKLLLLSLIALMSTPAFAKVCKDDARLYIIKSTIEKIDAGEKVKPIKLTPETFLDMPPIVRAKLGDNIRVYNKSCVPLQVYNGTLPKSIELPFIKLENSLQKALIRGDQKMADVILNQFIPAPISSDESVLLITSLPWPESALDNLYNYKYFSKAVQNNYTKPSSGYTSLQVTTCNFYPATPTHIELYALLGGRVSDAFLVGYNVGNTSIQITAENGAEISSWPESRSLSAKKDPSKFATCSGISIPRIISSLSSIGAKIQAIDWSNMHSTLMKVRLKMKNAAVETK